MTINSAICNQKENDDTQKLKEIRTLGFPRGPSVLSLFFSAEGLVEGLHCELTRYKIKQWSPISSSAR